MKLVKLDNNMQLHDFSYLSFMIGNYYYFFSQFHIIYKMSIS